MQVFLLTDKQTDKMCSKHRVVKNNSLFFAGIGRGLVHSDRLRDSSSVLQVFYRCVCPYHRSTQMRILTVIILTLVTVTSLVTGQLSSSSLGQPPNPSKPIGIQTLIGHPILYKNTYYPLNPQTAYHDRSHFINRHGLYAEKLVNALGRGDLHGGYYH